MDNLSQFSSLNLSGKYPFPKDHQRELVVFRERRTPDSIQHAYRLKDLALAAQNTMVVHLSGELQALTDHYKKEINDMSQMLQDLKSRLPPHEPVAPMNKKTKLTKTLTSSNSKRRSDFR
ncbi:hypothetical protein CEXT_15051 [Caerostris extrusa]|uniref:BLOC-1-related complex subunit 5 n=1 Tax=Caerostris extrusa TaxID=172846 RepID=A0AAV4R4F9_CAEEX|nr:hypothetical protein CEXT_15051 [Caerostris extrusa]